MDTQNKTYIDPKESELAKFIEMKIEGSFQMFNLLKFKELVEETQESGEAQYNTYMKAAAPFIQRAKAKVIYMGRPITSIIGPEQLEWDKLIILEYPSKAAFIKMATDKSYPSHLRKMALLDSRLTLCK